MDPLVVRHHPILEALHRHVPTRDSLVDQRSIGAPTERVGVGDPGRTNDAAALRKKIEENRVGVLDVLACNLGDFVCELRHSIDRVDEGVDAVGLERSEIGFSIGRRKMDETGAVFGRDLLHGDDPEGSVFSLGLEVGKRRLVGDAEQVGTLPDADDLVIFVWPDCVDPLPRHPGAGVTMCHPDVVDRIANGDGQIPRQGPRGRGPYQQFIPGIHHLVAVEDPEPHGHRRVVDVPISAEAHLEVRQRCRRTPRVRDHLECLVHEILIPQLLEAPPHRLHIRRVHRLVVIVEVDPSSDAAGDVVPVGCDVGDQIASRLVEAVNA